MVRTERDKSEDKDSVLIGLDTLLGGTVVTVVMVIEVEVAEDGLIVLGVVVTVCVVVEQILLLHSVIVTIDVEY